MRAGVGESVTLFDGSGAEFVAVVETLRSLGRRAANRRTARDRPRAAVRARGRRRAAQGRPPEVARREADRARRDRRSCRWSTERGVAQPTASALERLRRTVIEAAKQCGRNRLMRIARAASVGRLDCAESNAGDRQSPEYRRLLAHPGGTPLATLELASADCQRSSPSAPKAASPTPKSPPPSPPAGKPSISARESSASKRRPLHWRRPSHSVVRAVDACGCRRSPSPVD